MSALAKRSIGTADIMPMAEYAKLRAEQRRRISGVKRLRRVEVGPFATYYFENYDTMWHQVHEMLFIERGGEAQVLDELEAYNPLIPQGSELIATVMLEIGDPVRRENTLRTLGGIEDHMILSIGGETIRAIPDPTRENTSPEGKASSVQFVRFPLTLPQKVRFASGEGQVLLGFDHAHYGHLAVIPEAIRTTLAADLDL
jgi:hypothetical protein